MRDEEATVVFDNGSGTTKAGFGGEEEPRLVFPTIVGRKPDSEDVYLGDDALSRDVLSKKHPVQRGIITNWDDMERIWSYTFDRLNVDSKERPVLLTEAPMNAKQNKEKMAQIMFEKYEVPSLYISVPAILSMYATGRTKGIVVDCGDGVTSVAPFDGGNVIAKSLTKMNVAGRDLTEYLRRVLIEKGYNFKNVTERDMQEVKENTSYVAVDFEKEANDVKNVASIEKTYKLPDGQTIILGQERFACMEPIFKPSLVGLDSEGLHKVIYSSIMKCDLDIRNDMYSSLILSGGSNTSPGMAERLERELSALVPTTKKIKIIKPMHIKHLAWSGGSLLASLANFNAMWITRKEYDENGPSFVHTR